MGVDVPVVVEPELGSLWSAEADEEDRRGSWCLPEPEACLGATVGRLYSENTSPCMGPGDIEVGDGSDDQIGEGVKDEVDGSSVSVSSSGRESLGRSILVSG